MHVTILGAGPLGLFYAGHLRRVGAKVSLIRRQVDSPSEDWEFVSRVTGHRFVCSLDVVDEFPAETDVVVVAVRGEQLTAELVVRVLGARPKAVVCLTPNLGSDQQQLLSAHPEWVAAMPAIAAEIEGRQLFFWAPPTRWLGPLVGVAPATLIQRRGPTPALLDFVSLLRRASVAVSLTTDARDRGVANTVALFPLHVAIFVSPQMHRWLSNRDFLKQLAGAMVLARPLAKAVGPVDVGLLALGWWLSGERRLAWSVRVLLRLAPRLVGFLERHFGPKLAAQHVVLLRDVSALAQTHQMALPLPEAWVRQLLAEGPAAP